MKSSVYFHTLPIGACFRVDGYDDLFRKESACHAVSKGCGMLTRPVRFCRKGTKVSFLPDSLVSVL